MPWLTRAESPQSRPLQLAFRSRRISRPGKKSRLGIFATTTNGESESYDETSHCIGLARLVLFTPAEDLVRITLSTVLLASVLTSPLASQTSSSPSSAASPEQQAAPEPKPGQPTASGKADVSSLTLTGCVARGEGDDQFIVSDATNGTYRIKGKDVKPYVGKRVEVSGSTSKRVQIVGGLWPSPNVAAQGGAIDPVDAAIEAQSGRQRPGMGAKPLPELQAKRLRTVQGACP
jgi:hypothetical protein